MMTCLVAGRAGPCMASYSIDSRTAFTTDISAGPYVPVWKYPTSFVTGTCSLRSVSDRLAIESTLLMGQYLDVPANYTR